MGRVAVRDENGRLLIALERVAADAVGGGEAATPARSASVARAREDAPLLAVESASEVAGAIGSAGDGLLDRF